MTSNLYVDVMSLLKQVIAATFYIIMIKIEFIIMTDHYFISCHVKVLHASNFLRDVSLLSLLSNNVHTFCIDIAVISLLLLIYNY